MHARFRNERPLPFTPNQRGTTANNEGPISRDDPSSMPGDHYEGPGRMPGPLDRRVNHLKVTHNLLQRQRPSQSLPARTLRKLRTKEPTSTSAYGQNPAPQEGRRRMDTRTVRFSPRIEQLRNHLPARATPPFRTQHHDPTTLAGGRRRSAHVKPRAFNAFVGTDLTQRHSITQGTPRGGQNGLARPVC